jgi:hypothetical protein
MRKNLSIGEIIMKAQIRVHGRRNEKRKVNNKKGRKEEEEKKERKWDTWLRWLEDTRRWIIGERIIKWNDGKNRERREGWKERRRRKRERIEREKENRLGISWHGLRTWLEGKWECLGGVTV